jgi:hypothetical protein
MPTKSGLVFAVLLATMLFRIDTLPEFLIPPAEEEELLLMVLFCTSSVPEPLFTIPPPEALGAWLPLMVLFETFITPSFTTPPPAFIGKELEFPLTVLSTIVIVPPRLETPPPNGALFPVMLQPVMWTVPLVAFCTPPPETCETLFVITQLMRFSVPKSKFPTPPWGADPSRRVSPETVTVGGVGPPPVTKITPNGVPAVLPPTMES